MKTQSNYFKYRDWKSWSQTNFAKYSKSDSAYYRNELIKAGISSNFSELSCFEVGFGNASFSAWANDNGIRYFGTEVNNELLALAKENNLNVFSAEVDISKILEPRSIDLIVAFDVLEHLTIDEISALINSACRCLKPGGKIIARFPSGDSPFSRAMQHGDLTHRTTIGSLMIRQLCMQAGLAIYQIRSPAFPIFGLGVKKFIRRLPILLVRKAVEKSINLIYNDNQPRVISPNMLVVIQKQ